MNCACYRVNIHRCGFCHTIQRLCFRKWFHFLMKQADLFFAKSREWSKLLLRLKILSLLKNVGRNSVFAGHLVFLAKKVDALVHLGDPLLSPWHGLCFPLVEGERFFFFSFTKNQQDITALEDVSLQCYYCWIWFRMLEMGQVWLNS